MILIRLTEKVKPKLIFFCLQIRLILHSGHDASKLVFIVNPKTKQKEILTLLQKNKKKHQTLIIGTYSQKSLLFFKFWFPLA